MINFKEKIKEWWEIFKNPEIIGLKEDAKKGDTLAQKKLETKI